MPEEGKRRWCGACGKAKGAISLTTKQMCESCGNKRAHFGTPEEGKRRWCGACGKAKGAISLTTQQMCEGCGNIASQRATVNIAPRRRACASTRLSLCVRYRGAHRVGDT